MEELFERIRSDLGNDGAPGDVGDIGGIDGHGGGRWGQHDRARGVSEAGEALRRTTMASEKIKWDLVGARRQLKAVEEASLQVRLWMTAITLWCLLVCRCLVTSFAKVPILS